MTEVTKKDIKELGDHTESLIKKILFSLETLDTKLDTKIEELKMLSRQTGGK